MNDEEEYYEINNPESEKTLEKLMCKKIYLFRPNQLNEDKKSLRNIVFMHSQLSFTYSLFTKIYQFYQSLLVDDFLKQYQQEINEKMKFKATQSYTFEYLFYYFLMNIEVLFQKNQNSRYTQKFNFNTQMKYQDQFINLSEFEDQQFYSSITQIYFEELLRNKEFPVLVELNEYFIKVLNQSKPNKAIEQYYFESNYPKKVTKQQNQLFLQQNNNIIFTTLSKQTNLPLSLAKVVYFQKPKFIEQKLIDAQDYQLSSIGYLDMNYDHIGETKIYSSANLIFMGQMKQSLFEGQGKICNQGIVKYNGMFSYNQKHGQGVLFQNNLMYSGKFQSDDLFGEIIIQNQFGNQEKKYYLKGQVVTKEYFDQLEKTYSSQMPYLYYSFYCDYAINIQSYKALEPGKWLFEGAVDYFIEYFKNYFEYSEGKLNTIFFNTNDTSNYISNDEKNLFQIRQQLSDDIKAYRKVFVLNSQRSHFMIMVEDEGKLYCCDSLYVKNQNRDEEFSKLLGLKTRESIKLNCTQQMNGYDCGIFATYYAMKFMKYDKCSIAQIEQNLQAKNMAQFRWQLKQLIKNNHNYILTNI